MHTICMKCGYSDESLLNTSIHDGCGGLCITINEDSDDIEAAKRRIKFLQDHPEEREKILRQYALKPTVMELVNEPDN